MSETLRKARKEHECDGCDRSIAAGEHYWLHETAGRTAEGEFWSAREKQCGSCRSAAERYEARMDALSQIRRGLL